MKYIFTLLLLMLSSQSFSKENCADFDTTNFEKIFNMNNSGLYKNPFYQDRCFLLTFDNKKEIPQEALDITPEKMHSIIFLYYDDNDLFVSHIKDNEHYFNVFNFIKESKTLQFINIVSNEYPLIKKYKPLIWFIHEIYHLKDLDFEKDYIYDEADADLFAALFIYKHYNLNQDELKTLIFSLFEMRTTKIDINFKANPEKINIYKKYYKERAKKALTLIDKKHINSFNDLYELLKDID